MKSQPLKSSYIMIAFLLLASCSPYRNNPDLKLARDFMDAYYVMANHKEALALSEGGASEQIQKEMELLKGLSAQDEINSYKSRDVVFNLQKETKTDAEVVYFYEMKIIVPGMPDIKKMVNITIDRQNHKIKYFASF